MGKAKSKNQKQKPKAKNQKLKSKKQKAKPVKGKVVERAKRKDAGTIRVTERDMAIFDYLGEMKAIYENDLRVLLGRITGRTPSESAVRQTVVRWQKAELASAQKLIMRAPRIVRLLSNGARLVGIETWKETSEWTAYHQADVSRVRLWLESRPDFPNGAVVEWRSERRIRSDAALDLQGGAKGAHIPDAIITFADGTKAALEVERTVKEQARLRRILSRTTAAYPLTIYAIPKGATPEEQRKGDTIARAVNTAHEEVKSQARLRPGGLIIARFPEELET